MMTSSRYAARLRHAALRSDVAARARATVRTYPALEAAVRRLLRTKPRAQAAVRRFGTDERTEHEITNTLILDLIKRRRLDEAEVIGTTFLGQHPEAARTRFLVGIVFLYQGAFEKAEYEIDAAYARAWTVRDNLSHLPNWTSVIATAAAERPDWAWPRFMIERSRSQLFGLSPARTAHLLDDLDPATLVEISSGFGRGDHRQRADWNARDRVVVFEGSSSSLLLNRARLLGKTNASVVHVPRIRSIAASGGGMGSTELRGLLESEDIRRVDRLLIDAEFASAGILSDVFEADVRPRVLILSVVRMTVEQRLGVIRRLEDEGYFLDTHPDAILAVEAGFISNRRVHGWRLHTDDFDLQLADDFITESTFDLAAAVEQVLVQNQVRFFVTPTDNERITRFSLGNPDKAFAISRILEVEADGYSVHVRGISHIQPSTPLVSIFLIDGSRRLLSRAVELDFWTERDDYARSGNLNCFVNWIPKSQIERSMFGFNPPYLLTDHDRPTTMEERLDLRSSVLHHYDFPIDVVFTWVDGSDKAWLERRAARSGAVVDREVIDEQAARYKNRDELRYAMRSVCAFMPYARKIYLVTDDQIPAWLAPDDDRVQIVSHRDIFSNAGDLPTFNSNAIETQLGNIEDLAEHFVYFNDDILLLGPCPRSSFFHSNGMTRSFFETQRSQYGPADPAFHNSKNAVLNSSAAFENRFGKTFHQFHRHTPFPIRRSVLAAMAEDFPQELQRTAATPFRSIHDIAPISSLYQWYSYHRGASTPGNIAATYINLGSPNILDQLDHLKIGTTARVACVNDGHNEDVDEAAVDEALADCLHRLFPVAAPWERS